MTSGDIDLSRLMGAKVKIVSACLAQGWLENASSTYTISDVKFRIGIDGKTFAIIKLEELPDNTFTWRDLKVIKLGDE